MKFRIINTGKDFFELKDAWNSLSTGLEYSTPYQTWEWVYLYWKYFGANKELQILAYTDKEQLLAIFPFWVRNQFGLKFLEPIGTRGTDYVNILLDQTHQNEILSIFFDWFIKGDFDLINMEDIPSMAPHLNSLLECSDKLKLSKTVNYAYCPCYSIILPNSWEKYLQNLSGRAIKDTRYYIRYCSKEFNLIEYMQGKSSDIDKHFDLHQKSRAIKKDVGTYKSLKVRAFMREYAESMESTNKLRLVFLSLDNNIVASILGVEDANKRYNISIGYDPDYRKYRPGTLLYGYDIEDCIRRCLGQYDLSRGSDAYKIRMGAEQKYNVRVVISKAMNNISGYLQLNAVYMKGRDYAPSVI